MSDQSEDVYAGFGAAKYGDGGFKFIKLTKDSTIVVRIIPPMKSLQRTGKWAAYHGVHYGYHGVDPRDSSNTKSQPFKCVEQRDFRSQMTTVECPECLLVATKREERDRNERTLLAEGKSQADVISFLKPLDTWIRSHAPNRKWYINVLTADGTFGVLLLSNRTKKSLEQAVKDVRDQHVDPIAPHQGAWFSITRVGDGFSTPDSVKVVNESVSMNGQTFHSIKQAPLTAEQAADALSICPDLATVARAISFEQVTMLVASSGDPVEVDSIIGMTQNREASPAPVQRQAVPRPTPVPAPVYSAPVQVTAPAAPEADEEAAALAALEAIRAKKAATARQAVPAPTRTPSMPIPGDINSMSDEDFKALFKPTTTG